MGCIVYRPLCLRMYFTFVGIEGEIIYLHWRGAFGMGDDIAKVKFLYDNALFFNEKVLGKSKKIYSCT